MANHKKRKSKHVPNYSFLVSWSPDGVRVNRESNLATVGQNTKLTASKKAAELAKEDSTRRIKKDLISTLILVSFVLIIEVVVYLARNQIKLP